MSSHLYVCILYTCIKDERKEMFYLTTHSTYCYMASDILIVKDHSDSERGKPLPPHGLLIPAAVFLSRYLCGPLPYV